jgi:hypothetical protein
MNRLAIYGGLALGLGVAAWVLFESPIGGGPAASRTSSTWEGDPGVTVGERFEPPAGFTRVPLAVGSFGAFLRDLPLRPPDTDVLLFDAKPKARQDVHAAVVAMDLGDRNLQQCADTILRLRAEHLYAAGRMDDISFHFTNGFECSFRRWRRGSRVRVRGGEVKWVDGAKADASHPALRRYLDMVFAYAGTRSLHLDMVKAPDDSPVEPGDVYLQPGSPGHAMVVVDVAARGDARAMLLAQGFMPAQDAHVVKNPGSPAMDPWYVEGAGQKLVTPEWTFPWTSRWRFPAARETKAVRPPSGGVRR